MKAVVLAAGEGTRLQAVSRGLPKVLLDVGGEPLLTHGFRTLCELGTEGFVVVVGHRAGAIVDRYGDAFRDRPIEYVRQPERRGLAHALLQAAERVEGPFVAMHGDNFFPGGAADLRPVLDRRGETGAAASLLVERVAPERARAGLCIADPEGEVRRVVEHPTREDREAGLVVAGFYAFAPVVFRACRAVDPSERGEYELPDALTWLVERGHRVVAMPLRGRRVNVNEPDDLIRARRLADG